jgi:hypothetical protein
MPSLASVLAATTFELPSIAGVTRTLEDRLELTRSIKDFGAVGNGSIDDTDAIRAAIAWTTAAARGRIKFPKGIYLVSGQIDISWAPGGTEPNFIFEGEGEASIITGSVNGFIFNRDPALVSYAQYGGVKGFEKLAILNSYAGGGGIRFGATVGGFVRDCSVTADRCIDTIRQTLGDGVDVVYTGWNTSFQNLQLRPTTPWTPNGYGLAMGFNSSAVNLDVSNFDVAVHVFGLGCAVFGGRFEVNKTAFSLGSLPDFHSWSLTSTILSGFTCESNGTAIKANGGVGSTKISGVLIQGYPGGAPYAGIGTALGPITITGATSGAVATGCTIDNNRVLTIPPGGITGTFQLHEVISGAGIPSYTLLNFQLSGPTGLDGNYELSGSPIAGIDLNDNASVMVIDTVSVSGAYQDAAIRIGHFARAGRGCVTFISCTAANNGTAVGSTLSWGFPPSANQAVFINCDAGCVPVFPVAQLPFANVTASLQVNGTSGLGEINITSFNGGHVFQLFDRIVGPGVAANKYIQSVNTGGVYGQTGVYTVDGTQTLASTSMVITSAVEGDEWNVSDGMKSGGVDGDPIGFGDLVVGGGTHHIKVRWDGANLRRSG